jgi:enoyl-CoA hydratase
MSADLVVCTDDTLFSHPAWRYLGPVFNYFTLLETIGRRATMELLFTGGPFTAQRALQLSMVNSVVSRDQLDAEVQQYVGAAMCRSMDGMVMGKVMLQMISNARGLGLGEMSGWLGHPWMTNQVYNDWEYNWTKERRDKGFSRAIAEVDERIPQRFRLSRNRRAKQAPK